MKAYTSSWVVPVSSPPIFHGAVAVEAGRIAAVGERDAVLSGGSLEIVDLGDAVLMPAFVNAHTHLELSWMAGESLPTNDFIPWVRAMIGRRTPPAPEVESSIARAIASLSACGTALVGDVGNTTAALPLLGASSLSGRFFLELIGARDERAGEIFEAGARLLESAPDSVSSARRGQVTASLAPHGPHSVSRELLALVAERARSRGEIVSVHLAESRAEVDFLVRGDGPFRGLLDEAGSLGPGWRPAGAAPSMVLDEAGLLGPRTLLVHGVHLTRPEARLIASRGSTVVLCPRSNARLGVGAAPVAMLIEERVRLALGTDSLASNEDLDVRAELVSLRALAPHAPPDVLVRAATLGGAEALGSAGELGSIEPGKLAALVALARVPQRGRHPDRTTGAHERSSSRREVEPYATIFAGSDEVRVSSLIHQAPDRRDR